ncbi:MAG: two-component regulator propeller domain-containing protein [Bacteroidota bacterium]|jgi:ligand-binding sensor domain-containing protein
MALVGRNIGLQVLLALTMALLACNHTPPTSITPVGPKWVSFNKSNSGLLNNHVNAILTDAEGIIWIATDSGASSFSNGFWNCFVDSLSYPMYETNGNPHLVSIVTSIALSPDRSLWFGLAGGGVSRYKRQAVTIVWKRFTTANGLPSDDVLSITADQKLGEIWCATFAGVGRFIPTTNEGGVWRRYDTSNSFLPSNHVECVAYNLIDFSIWFGTQNAGVTFINAFKVWQQPINDYGQLNYPVVAIAFDVSTTWFATWDGIFSFAPATYVWRQYVSDNTHGIVPSGIVDAVTTDYLTTRWFGTNAGLVRLSDTSWTKINRQSTPELPSDTVTALARDFLGNLWIGTVNGVAVYNESGTRF